MLRKLILLAGACWMLALPQAYAAIGKTWTTAGADEFSAGDLQGVSVLSTGEIELAPEARRIEGLDAEFVWDVELGDDGTIYASVGSPAAVYAVRSGRAELLYKGEELHALCLLPMPDGALLLGTAPKGIIYRVDRHGKAEVFADLEEHYVWDMALGPQSQVYCATGPNGRLLELGRDGAVTERLKVKQKNLMCLAVDAEDTVCVGTEPDGYVYRIPRRGKASLLYDADEGEIHALALDGEGRLYACTAQSKGGGPPAMSPSASSAEASSSSSSRGQPPAPNSIYRIVPERGAERLAAFPNILLLSLAVTDGRVMAGTGPDGRIVSVDEGRTLVGVLTEFDAKNVTAMAAAPSGEVIVGTSKAGQLWQLKSGVSQTGTFTSKAFNAGYLARWGRAWWSQKADVGQTVRVRVRTGNSAEPDEHWSDWSDWIREPTGGDLDVPMGRFAQFAAELQTRPKTGSPCLIEVSVSYRQVNRRPVISDLAVDGESVLQKNNQRGSAGETGRPSTGAPRPSPPRDAKPQEKQIVWKAGDPNGDALVFDLHYRGVDEREWKELDSDLEGQPVFKWDTSRVPDGYYLLKLTARDGTVRPADEALSHERTSRPVLVDNRAPVLVEMRARRQADGSYRLTGTARDDLSPITAIEVSHNSDDWQPVFPADGILDSPEEGFSYVTDVLEPGEHVFAFVAEDTGKNTGSGKLVVDVQ